MIASRFLPPLVVAAGFAASALALRPATDEPPVPQDDQGVVDHGRAPVIVHQRPPVHETVELDHGDIAGCFAEFHEREPGDADMAVTFAIQPDGYANQASSTSVPDSASLRMCVQEAILRQQFGRGSEVIGVEAQLAWRDEVLSIGTTITDRRPATKWYRARM
jgi:hypothetical protein